MAFGFLLLKHTLSHKFAILLYSDVGHSRTIIILSYLLMGRVRV